MDNLTIRKAANDEMGLVCRLWNLVWQKLPRAEEELIHDIETLEERFQSDYRIAEIEGTPVGILNLYRDIGSFHPQKWTVEVAVVPEYRGHGLGSWLYAEAEQFLSVCDVLALYSHVMGEDEVSMEFAKKRGFVEVKRDFDSILDLTGTFPPPATIEGIRIASFSDEDSVATRHQLHELFDLVRIDTPRTDPPTPFSFEDYEKLVVENPMMLPSITTLAFSDSRLVGFSTAFRAAEPSQMGQGLTGVHRDFRGRGIAQAIKLDVIRKAKEQGFAEIHTDNDTRNKSMLAINEKLGFVRSWEVAFLCKLT